MVIKSMSYSIAAAVLVSVSIAAPGSVSQTEARDAQGHEALAAPYAQATWMKLGELIPMDVEGPDVYVRLIAIEGEVLLQVDDDR
jgi:hypothetical protein